MERFYVCVLIFITFLQKSVQGCMATPLIDESVAFPIQSPGAPGIPPMTCGTNPCIPITAFFVPPEANFDVVGPTADANCKFSYTISCKNQAFFIIRAGGPQMPINNPATFTCNGMGDYTVVDGNGDTLTLDVVDSC